MKNAANIGADAGVVMADTLIAVVIVSLMIAVCLGSLKIVRAFSATAAESRTAAVTLATVVDSVPRLAGDYNGVSGAATYHARVTEEKFDQVRLCRIDVAVRPNPKSKSYRLSATRWCDRATDAAA